MCYILLKNYQLIGLGESRSSNMKFISSHSVNGRVIKKNLKNKNTFRNEQETLKCFYSAIREFVEAFQC